MHTCLPASLHFPLAMYPALATPTTMASSTPKQPTRGARTATSGWRFGDPSRGFTGPQRCRYRCTHTFLGSQPNLQHDLNKHISHVLYGLSCTHCLICPAPRLRDSCVVMHTLSLTRPLHRVCLGSLRSCSRPPLPLPPYCSPPINNDTPIPSP